MDGEAVAAADGEVMAAVVAGAPAVDVEVAATAAAECSGLSWEGSPHCQAR